MIPTAEIHPRTLTETLSANETSLAEPLVRLRKLFKIYETPVGVFRALDGIDLDVQQGQFVSIVGRSGCGKSTLVNMITGLDHPSAGSIHVGGTDILSLDESARSRWRGAHLGIVFQFFQLLPTLTLLQNVLLPMDLTGQTPPERRLELASSLLAEVGLAELADAYPLDVSGGQQQSAAIARALANDPELVVADEPTGNLDSAAALRILSLFDQLHRRGKTILMVTHDPQMAERASRRLTLAEGRIVADDLF